MRRLFALATLVLAIGCDSATSPADSIVGTWNLQTVNGAPLPFTLFGSGANREDLISGSITFQSGGSFSNTAVFRSTTNGVAGPNESSTSTGTYTVTGTTVTITTTGETGGDTGTLNGDTLTATGDGLTLVFKKQ